MIQAIALLGDCKKTTRFCAKLFAQKYKEAGIETEFCDTELPLRKIQAFAYAEVGRPSPGCPKSWSFLDNDRFLSLKTEFQPFLESKFLKDFLETKQKYKDRSGSIITADATVEFYPLLKRLGFVTIGVMQKVFDQKPLDFDFQLVDNETLHTQITCIFADLQGGLND